MILHKKKLTKKKQSSLILQKNKNFSVPFFNLVDVYPKNRLKIKMTNLEKTCGSTGHKLPVKVIFEEIRYIRVHPHKSSQGEHYTPFIFNLPQACQAKGMRRKVIKCRLGAYQDERS